MKNGIDNILLAILFTVNIGIALGKLGTDVPQHQQLTLICAWGCAVISELKCYFIKINK